jgi:hypothetical protein
VKGLVGGLGAGAVVPPRRAVAGPPVALVALFHLDFLCGTWAGLDERAAGWLAAQDERLFRLDGLYVATSLRIAAHGATSQDEAALSRIREEGQGAVWWSSCWNPRQPRPESDSTP